MSETSRAFEEAIRPGQAPPPGGLNSPNSLISRKSVARKKPVLDEAALYGIAGKAVRAISPYTEASQAAILFQLLGGFGVLVGPNVGFRFGNTVERLRINTVLVGASGTGRKGTSWNDARCLLRRVDPNFEKIVVSGLSSGEGLIQHVRDPQYKSMPIKEGQRIVGYQDEIVDSGATEKRAYIIESEFARVLKVAGRDKNTLSEVLRDAFDKDRMGVITKTPLQASDFQVAFVGHITEFELVRELDDTSKANGLGNRVMWVYSERSKKLPFLDEMPASVLNESVQEFRRAQEFATNVTVLKRTPSADAMWAGVYDRLTPEADTLLDSLLSRATSHVTRLACIFALLDQSKEIDDVHLSAALALWYYAEDTARFIFGSRVGDKVADTILAALEESPTGLSRTELSNVLGRHCKADVLSGSLAQLERIGRIVSIQEQTGGAPRTIYSVAMVAK